MPDVPLADAPPSDDAYTAYDHAHRSTYLRLLDAAAEHADWREVARVVLDVDPTIDEGHARRVHDAHLARARWMTQAGYKHLLRDGIPDTRAS